MTKIVEGIVLYHLPARENDLRVGIFSKEKGKIELLVRGARKMNSKMRGQLEVGNIIEGMVAYGRWQWYLAGCRTVQAYSVWRRQYDSNVLALMVIEAVNYIQAPEEADNRVYLLAKEWLDFLEENPGIKLDKKNWLLAWTAVWHLLTYAGYQPELYKCLRSSRPIAEGNHFFSLSGGGLVSKQYKQKQDRPVSVGAVKILRLLQQKDKSLKEIYMQLKYLIISADLVQELEKLLSDFAHFTLEQEIMTWQKLKQ